MFNHNVRIFASPYTDIRPPDQFPHCCLWNIPLTTSLNVDFLVTWQMSLPNMIRCVHGCTSSAWTQFLTETTFLSQFCRSTDLFRGWRIICKLCSEFSLDSHHRFLLSKTPAHRMIFFFKLSFHLNVCAVFLWQGWNYFLGMRAEHTFLSCYLQRRAFNFCVPVTFLSIKWCSCWHRL
jgi:hypothetical protein